MFTFLGDDNYGVNSDDEEEDLSGSVAESIDPVRTSPVPQDVAITEPVQSSPLPEDARSEKVAIAETLASHLKGLNFKLMTTDAHMNPSLPLLHQGSQPPRNPG